MPTIRDLVPPILAYADLATTKDGRNLEATKMIYDEFIEPILEMKHDQIDPIVLEAIRKIDEIANKHETRYFLAGATVREVILRHDFGRPRGRRTLDVPATGHVVRIDSSPRGTGSFVSVTRVCLSLISLGIN